MKKKLIYILATVLLIALTTVALVSCTNSPFDIIKSIDTAKSYTISQSYGDNSIISIYNKGNISVMRYVTTEETVDGKVKSGIKLNSGEYYIKNGDKYNKYVTADGTTWTKVEVDTKIVDEIIAELKKTTLAATEHIQKDRVVKRDDYWYVKGDDGKVIEEFAYEVINGSLYMLAKDPEDGKLTEVFYYKQSGEVSVPSSVKKAVGEIKK